MLEQEGQETEIVESPGSESAPEAPETPEVPEVEGETSEETESGESEGTEDETPAYSPNYKYKVLQKEKEIPEKYRALIKSAEDEKELRELFEAAEGLKEHYKPKHEALEQTFNQLQTEQQAIMGHIEEARAHYQRGDLDAFFEKLAIPQQRILQYALEKLDYQNLPPEQKAMVDARRMAERQNFDMQRNQNMMVQGYQQQVQQAHNMLLASELARPEVKSAMEAFDQRNGKPGSFLNEVRNQGQLAWVLSNGKNVLTPSQAVEQVIAKYGLRTAPASAASQATAPASAGGNKAKTSTIPNVGGGRSAAPLKQKPRSIEDLKKMRDELIARDG